MNWLASIVGCVVMLCGLAHAQDVVSLPYEHQTIDEIAGTVLSIPEFGEKGYLQDLELLSVRFSVGTPRDAIYRELVSLKKRFLYCTSVYTSSKEPSVSLRVFHYPKDHEGLYERSIIFQFQFDEDGKLISCSHYGSNHKYGGEPKPAEPTALAPAEIESRARNLSLAARLAHG